MMSAAPIAETLRDGTDDRAEYRQAALDAYGLELSKMRREAINGRQNLGIEDEWLEDEEAYIGVDEANHHEFPSYQRRIKPTASGQWSTADKPATAPTKSTVLPNITRPYVDAAAARIADMLLPSTERCWSIDPTPVPDLMQAAKSEVIVPIDETGFLASEKDFARAMMEVAKEHAERAELRIDDWMQEGDWISHARQVIETGSRLGTGVLKGPYPKRKRLIGWEFSNHGASKKIKYVRMPVSASVNPWNLFPDPACGENIQRGSYVWERDDITPRQILALMNQPGYIRAQLEAVLLEGPVRADMEWTPRSQIDPAMVTDRTLYDIWYMEGLVELSDLENCGLDVSTLRVDESGHQTQYAGATVTMINHRVVRAALTPIDDASFPYDVFAWQKRPGMWPGMGIARQIRTPQRMLTGATRNLMDNAGLSSGAQIVIDTDALEPADGQWTVSGRKVWKRRHAMNGTTADVFDVEKAFKIFTIETRQVELLNIVNHALRMAEESTGLPMILQGQMGEKEVSTLGQTRILNNNATAVLRRLAKQFDEGITIPHLKRYYHWLMEYGQDPREKGDFSIVAKGSTSLVERDIQNQELVFLLEMANNPIYEIDPVKAGEEWLRSRHIDPKSVKKDEMQLEEEAQNQPTDPRIQAAAIKAQDAEAARALDAQEREADREADLQGKLLDINSKHALHNAEAAKDGEDDKAKKS